MVNNIDHWSIFSTTLFTFFPDSYVTHAAIYFSFQLSFSLVQMQPLEPFQVLQSEDPQVFPYMRISPNLPQNCPRRATTARPGSPSEFNDFSSHLFFINICQQVSSHIAKKKPQTLFDIQTFCATGLLCLFSLLGLLVPLGSALAPLRWRQIYHQ